MQRERNTWIGADRFSDERRSGPAIGESVVIRRSSKLILVGRCARAEVGGKVERTAGGARVVIAVQPTTPYKVTRDGNKLTVRFDAVALDATPLTGFITEFASAAKVDGPSLIIDLGPRGSHVRRWMTTRAGAITIELLPPAPPPPPPSRHHSPTARRDAAPAASAMRRRRRDSICRPAASARS